MRQLSLVPKLLMIVLLFLSTPAKSAQNCHYSCETCVLPYHQYCKSCIDRDVLFVVKSPLDVPKQFRQSKLPTGICTPDSIQNQPNILGIVLLVSVILLTPISKSIQLFYIAYSLQSLNLLSFIQLGWLNPVSYLLNSFQYLSPCNLIVANTKEYNWEIRQYSYFYLHRMFGQPQLISSFSLLGIVNVIVFSFILIINLTQIIKKKYYPNDCQIILCAEWLHQKVLNYLSCIYFFLIQESVLSIVVALQFQTIRQSSTTAIIIVYSIMGFAFLVYIYRNKITMFPNRFVQYYTIAKKIVYPIFVLVPFRFQFFLFILMFVNCIFQIFFEYKVQIYPFKSRNTIFKIVELLSLLFFGIFYAIDSTSNTEKGPQVVNGILSAFICLMIGFFYLEVILSIKENIYQKNKKNELSVVPQNSILGRSKNETGLISTKRQELRQATESQLIQNEKKRENKLNQIIQQVSQIQPPKAERDQTKDTSFKKSQIIQEIKLQEQENKNKNKVKKQKSKKDLNSVTQDKQAQLRLQLKKRYGV